MRGPVSRTPEHGQPLPAPSRPPRPGRRPSTASVDAAAGTVDARTELHHAEALAARHQPPPSAAHDAPREDADDLPADHRSPVVLEPDLGPLVQLPGFDPVRGQELPGSDTPRGSRGLRPGPVHVDVHRRQEDADLLPSPAARRPAPRRPRPSRGRRPATRPGWRRRRRPVRIAKEEDEEGGEHQNGTAQSPAQPPPGQRQRSSAAMPMNGMPARSISMPIR